MHGKVFERAESFSQYIPLIKPYLHADARCAGMALEELVLRLQHEVGALPLRVRLVAVRPRRRRHRRCMTRRIQF